MANAGLALRLALAVAVALLASRPASAGGLYVNEFATTVEANAGAGRGAWVPDASATLHNPATMTRLDEHGLASGFSLAFGRIRFDPSSSSPSGSQSGGNQAGVAPISSLNYAHKLSDRVRLGVSFFSLSGSLLDPRNDWAGRFEMTELSLLTISFGPSVAVRLTDWLSIGGGPLASYGRLDWDLRVDFPAGTEGNVRLDDLDDWEPAGRVGLLLHPSEDLSLSVYYNSKTDFDLSGTIRVPAGLSSRFELELPLVQFAEVSAYWQATQRLALLGTFNWEDWSEADDLSVTLGSRTIGATTGMKDTYKIAAGANYQLAPKWLVQTGFSYDTSALSNDDRTTVLPIDRQIRAAAGAQYDWSESFALGLSFVFADLGRGEVRKETVRGDYQDNQLFIFGVTLAFKSLPWKGRLALPPGAL